MNRYDRLFVRPGREIFAKQPGETSITQVTLASRAREAICGKSLPLLKDYCYPTNQDNRLNRHAAERDRTGASFKLVEMSEVLIRQRIKWKNSEVCRK